MPDSDRNESFENLTAADSFTDPGGTTWTGSIDSGSSETAITLENTDGTTLMTTDTLQAGTALAWSDDGDGTATLGVTNGGIGTTELSFDPATQSELDSHAGTSGAHHSKTTSASDLTDVSADSVSDAHHTKTQPSDIDSANWGDYEIQKNGTDGAGVINFKTQ